MSETLRREDGAGEAREERSDRELSGGSVGPAVVDEAPYLSRTWRHMLADHLQISSINFGVNLIEGGEVTLATDEDFAEAKNLLDPREPAFDLGNFDPKRGQKMDSWESGRHSECGVESATIKLPRPSKIGCVAIDTKWHDGNQPQAAQLMVSEDGQAWLPLTMATPLQGHSLHLQRVEIPGEWNYVCLFMFPDGGIARLRLYEDVPQELHSLKTHDMHHPTAEGTLLTLRHREEIVRPEKRPFLGPSPDIIRLTRVMTNWEKPVNLADIELGAKIVGKSDARYSHADNILKPNEPENMGDGWEMARYRLPLEQVLSDHYREIWNHAEWVVIELSDRGLIEEVETNFLYFNFNNPKFMEVEACDLADGEDPERAEWKTLVQKMPVKQFASQAHVKLQVPQPRIATHLRVKVYPCGGVHRIRAKGRAIRPDVVMAQNL